MSDAASAAAPNRLRQLAGVFRPRALAARWGAMRASERVMTVLIGVLLAVVLVTYDRYGFTFDEMEGFFRAKRVFAVLSSGRMAEPSDIDTFHGAAPDVIALVLQRLIPPLSYNSAPSGLRAVWRRRHLLPLPAGSKFAGEWVGVFAALFLAATPMWFGYMFINHKDIPFATLLVASSYYCLLALTEHAPSGACGSNSDCPSGFLRRRSSPDFSCWPFRCHLSRPPDDLSQPKKSRTATDFGRPRARLGRRRLAWLFPLASCCSGRSFILGTSRAGRLAGGVHRHSTVLQWEKK